MRIIVFWFLFLTLAGGCKFLLPGPKGKKVTQVRAPEVIKVKMKEGGATSLAEYQVLRLIGYEPPRPGTREYSEAISYLRDTLDGKRVLIKHDEPEHPVWTGKDRMPAYVFLGELFIQEELISRGLGRFSTELGPTRFNHRLKAAEDQAREAGLGVWSD